MNIKIQWVAARIGADKYKTEIITDTHSFIADEPIALGGQDLAPDPNDFMRASLASCTAITLRMYADRKKLSVDSIEVKVGTESVNGKTIFHTRVKIEGAIDEDQRERMLQIAKACPIHKLLLNPIEIVTNLA